MHWLYNSEECVFEFCYRTLFSRSKPSDFLVWAKAQVMEGQEHFASLAWSAYQPFGKPSLKSLKATIGAMGIPWIPMAGPNLEKGIRRLLHLGLIKETKDVYEISDIAAHVYQSGKLAMYLASLSTRIGCVTGANAYICSGLDDSKGAGSGFFVSNSEIITCRHVVEDMKDLEISIRDETGQNFSVKQRRYHPNDAIDLCLLLTNEVRTKFAMAIGEEAEILDTVVSCGYPPIPQVNPGCLIVHRCEVSAITDDFYVKMKKAGVFSHLFPPEDLPQPKVLILSSILKPGNSGGPVLNEAGRVVGVVAKQLENMRPEKSKDNDEQKKNENSESLAAALGYSIAISSEHITELFKV